MLPLLGAFAEFERALIQDRVIAGVRRAQANGIHCGRPKVEIDLRPAVAMLEKGHGLGVTAKAMGVARSTLRRRLLEALKTCQVICTKDHTLPTVPPGHSSLKGRCLGK